MQKVIYILFIALYRICAALLFVIRIPLIFILLLIANIFCFFLSGKLFTFNPFYAGQYWYMVETFEASDSPENKLEYIEERGIFYKTPLDILLDRTHEDII